MCGLLSQCSYSVTRFLQLAFPTIKLEILGTDEAFVPSSTVENIADNREGNDSNTDPEVEGKERGEAGAIERSN